MSEKVAPALTREEWAEWFANLERLGELSPRPTHGYAAYALWGRPYGFTHEDVEALRELFVGFKVLPSGRASLYRSLADRPEALLPPKNP